MPKTSSFRNKCNAGSGKSLHTAIIFNTRTRLVRRKGETHPTDSLGLSGVVHAVPASVQNKLVSVIPRNY